MFKHTLPEATGDLATLSFSLSLSSSSPPPRPDKPSVAFGFYEGFSKDIRWPPNTMNCPINCCIVGVKDRAIRHSVFMFCGKNSKNWPFFRLQAYQPWNLQSELRSPHFTYTVPYPTTNSGMQKKWKPIAYMGFFFAHFGADLCAQSVLVKSSVRRLLRARCWLSKHM